MSAAFEQPPAGNTPGRGVGLPLSLRRTGKIISWRCLPSSAYERFDVEHHNVPNLIGLGERLKKSHRQCTRPAVGAGVMPLSALAAALFFALGLGMPAANAEDALPTDPGQVIIVPPPVESPPLDPAPSDPGTPPADTTMPAPITDPPPPAVTDPPAASAPAAPPAEEIPAQVTVTPPVVGPVPATVVPPAARVVPVQPLPSPGDLQPSAEPSTAGSTPTPSATATKSAVAVPKKAPADPQAGTKIQAAVVSATGSPFAIQLLTVLALLGAGFAYFRVLGSKGFRTSKTGK
jgi:hypothetical protein